MGKTKSESKHVMQRMRISPTALLVLKILAAAGIAVAVLALPGMSVALAPFLKNKKGKKRHLYMNQNIRRLEKRGFVRVSGSGKNRKVALTRTGKEFLSECELWESKLPTSAKWDKKWRIVMFDFPQRYERARRIFRLKLLDWGFEQYQKSVFIFPHSCEKEVRALANYLKVSSHIRYLEADTVERGSMLQKTFRKRGILK